MHGTIIVGSQYHDIRQYLCIAHPYLGGISTNLFLSRFVVTLPSWRCGFLLMIYTKRIFNGHNTTDCNCKAEVFCLLYAECEEAMCVIYMSIITLSDEDLFCSSRCMTSFI